MKKDISTLSSFISRLDAEILNEEEAVLLKGGFAPTITTEANPTNNLCNTDNCTCPITNHCNGDKPVKLG